MKRILKSALIAVLCISMMIPLCIFSSAKIENPFDDLPAGKWYTEGCLYCFHKSYMSGTGDKLFSPNQEITRSQIVLILAKVDNIEDADYNTQNYFDDVKDTDWFYEAVNWAYEKGITKGVSDRKFDPKKSLTRQELAVFLYAYAQYKEFPLDYQADITAFADYSEVSNWSKTAMSWAVECLLIAGSNNKLMPKDTATRGQCALIIRNFVVDFIEKPLTVGESYFMGSYEQDNDLANGKEALEWVVLKVVPGKALLITKYAIDNMMFDDTYSDEVFWYNCSLRSYLNGQFIEETFNEAEQKKLKLTHRPVQNSSQYGFDAGEESDDKVFVLDCVELNEVLPSEFALRCEPTPYAKARGATYNEILGTTQWWTTTLGIELYRPVAVDIYGTREFMGTFLDDEHTCVRPAMWISY